MSYRRLQIPDYGFVDMVRECLGVSCRLDEINEPTKGQFQVGSDSSTSFHKAFYDKYRAGWPEMVSAYHRFLKDEVMWMFPGSGVLFQKFPTFRVHLPGNVAVGAFHTDAEFGHPPGEENFIIPLTDSGDTASTWVESAPGKGDFEPMVMRVGELIHFKGNVLKHGNHVNSTGKTRVSMDFRILPARFYTGGGESLTLKKKFTLGDYYDRFDR